MKQNFHSTILLVLLLIFLTRSSQTSARTLALKQGEADEMKMSSQKMKSSVAVDSFNKLMGVEEEYHCEHEDEECLKRRVVAEAHLDYIYTQQHKP